MEHLMTESVRHPIDERLPWHSPELIRLEVSLDTRDSGGSQGDGEFGTVFDDA